MEFIFELLEILKMQAYLHKNLHECNGLLKSTVEIYIKLPHFVTFLILPKLYPNIFPELAFFWLH